MSSDGEHHGSLVFWKGISTKSLPIQISHICIFDFPQISDVKGLVRMNGRRGKGTADDQKERQTSKRNGR